MVTRLFRTADYLDEQPGFFTKPGKQVIEVSVLPAQQRVRSRTPVQNRWKPTVTIYAGDDDTDEDVFSYLWPNDIGIKIGNGPTTADSPHTPSPDDLECSCATWPGNAPRPRALSTAPALVPTSAPKTPWVAGSTKVGEGRGVSRDSGRCTTSREHRPEWQVWPPNWPVGRVIRRTANLPRLGTRGCVGHDRWAGATTRSTAPAHRRSDDEAAW